MASASPPSASGDAGRIEGNETSSSAPQPPEMFLCPISREVMRDPVVLVETGQIYDRSNINEWFKKGNNTCPLSGTKLTNRRLAPLFAVRGAIQEWASSKGIEIPAPPQPSTLGTSIDPKESPIDQFGPLDDPCHCLSVVSSRGVSAYDVGALFVLVQERTLPQSYAALVLLREMTRHIDGQQLKRIRKEFNMDTLKGLVDCDSLQIPAARLLVQMKGVLHVPEMIPMLKIDDLDLRRQILTHVFEHAYRHRGRMMEVADAVEAMGVSQCTDIIQPLVQDSDEAANLSVTAHNGAALVLASLAYRKRYRSMVAETATPALVNLWKSSGDPGMKYPLAKAVQYLSEHARGRQAAQVAGAVSEFVRMLPPVNSEVDYSDFVFDDFFAFVTVPDTALKALFHLAQNPAARRQMIEGGVVTAVREMISSTQLSDDTKSKYAKKLLDILTTSPEFRLRRLMTSFYRGP
ncbi:hypothetical protein BSKO_06411 [Bryopsis sp. KO-2023]|nr:hypothetical protein BSKO_06411 [Bryopsis sp. KO-2023]